jgi:hypothetical protein
LTRRIVAARPGKAHRLEDACLACGWRRLVPLPQQPVEEPIPQ